MADGFALLRRSDTHRSLPEKKGLEQVSFIRPFGRSKVGIDLRGLLKVWPLTKFYPLQLVHIR